MNTLSRAITARFFPNPDSYNALRIHWSDLINSERRHELSAAHHLLYVALLGRDWRKAFTPLSNRRKLDNGAFWNWGLFRALQSLHLKSEEEALLAPFDGLITTEILGELRNRLPTAGAYTYKPSDFAGGSFPFEAYKENQDVRATANPEESHG